MVEAAAVFLGQPVPTTEALAAFALELRQAELALALVTPGDRDGQLFLHFFYAAGHFGGGWRFCTGGTGRLLTLSEAH